MYKYSHGGNAVFEKGNYDKKDIIDLSANINPLGMPEGVRDAIIREIPQCERYPDSFSKELCEKIADFENVTPSYIFCGNGASDVIFRLPRAAHAKKVMITAPTFSDYERSAQSYGSEIVRYVLSSANGFDINSNFIEAVRHENPDLVFICNPNNPTGRLTKIETIQKLLDCCMQTGARVALDECFLDFTENAAEYSSKAFIRKYPNLIILKAFTKIFGLPGIRLGYAICTDKTLINSLYYYGADWPVSNLAQAAGIAALTDGDNFIKKTAAYVSAERMKIGYELSQLGYKVFESKANYVFVQNPYPFNLWEELDKRAIRIRSCSNYHGLDASYCRIAVSTKENNRKFLTAISEVTELYKKENRHLWK